VADFADAPLALRAEVEVAVFEEKIGAVGLWRDGEFHGRRDNLSGGHGQLVTAHAPLLGADEARNGERRFPSEVL